MKYFITYGDQKFVNSKKRICHEASSLFDVVIPYGPEDTSIEVNNNVRGGGFWLWKRQIVKKTLSIMNDGDLLLYCDAGCTINPDRYRLQEYFDMTEHMLFFKLGHQEKLWTKEDAFHYFSSPDEHRESVQILATAFIIKKTPESVQFVDTWCDVPYQLFTDTCVLPNCADFRDHRHDQSVLSLLVKNNQGVCVCLEDETWPVDARFPINATRKRC
jgi:hypothetical protein